MIAHYIKIGLRTLLKNKLTGFINIIGLALSFACAFYMLLYVSNERSYDKMHVKKERIYRVVAEKTAFMNFISPGTPYLLAPLLQENYPSIEKFTRTSFFYKGKVKKDNEYLKSRIYCADNEIFDIFTIPLVKGQPGKLLTEPNTAVISETIAGNYFGTTDVVDRSINIEYNGKNIPIKITAVMKDMSKFSTFRADVLLSMNLGIEDLCNTYSDSLAASKWSYNHHSTYLLLKKGTRIEDIQQHIEKIEKLSPPSDPYKFTFQNLEDVYLRSANLKNNPTVVGDLQSVRLFSMVALLILLIAGFNYVILSSSQAMRRYKEIGMRKVLGASRQNLVIQILCESIFITLMALPLAFMMVKIFLPDINKLFGLKLTFTIMEHHAQIGTFIAMGIAIGILAGLYLAVYMSRLQPIAVLYYKNNLTGRKPGGFRKMLIVLQIAIFAGLTFYTTVVYMQIKYTFKTDLGYDKDNLILIDCYGIGEKYSTLKNELTTNTDIIAICGGGLLPPTNNSSQLSLSEPDNHNEQFVTEVVDADFDFIETYRIKLLEGRNFSSELKSDSNAILINQTAQKTLKIAPPFPNISNPFKQPIIGVMHDFNIHSLSSPITPIVIFAFNKKYIQYISQIAIRIKPGTFEKTISYIEQTYTKLTGEQMQYNTVNGILKDMMWKEYKHAKILRLFTICAILIALLGLFGLSYFTSMQRRREICIRKIHGASIAAIIKSQLREYFILVLIGCVVAFPLAFYFSTGWLRNYAYHTKISWLIYPAILAFTVFIVFIVVLWQVYRLSKTNPAEVLRYE